VSVASQPADGATGRRGSRRRRWRIILSCLLALVAVSAGIYLYVRWSGQRDLDAAIAETDQLDPRWRCDDLIADRTPIPDEQNPALIAMKADALTRPGGFALGEKGYRLLDDIPAQHRLNAPQIAVLREALARHEEALKVAKTLRDFQGEGRFPINYGPDFLSFNRQPLERNGGVMVMLMYDAMLRAEDDDIGAAMQSCRALLVATRSLGDEPFLIGMIMRVAGATMLVQAVERVLAQGEPPVDELRAIQGLIAREIEAPVLYNAMRGERAGLDAVITALDKGDIQFCRLLALPAGTTGTWGERLIDVFPAVVTRG
jgi:hypothetical protein